MTAFIDHRDSLWLLTAPGLNAEMGFFSLAAARSFAKNNLCLAARLTNRAIVRSVTERVA
jgi:hypothetical protein